MSGHNQSEKPKSPGTTDRQEAQLDEALDMTFPASDPVAIGHSDHAGAPPNHQPSAESPRTTRHKPS